jgi:HSP20 family protein
MQQQRREGALATRADDPFTVLRQMTSELDRFFDDWPFGGRLRQRGSVHQHMASWTPRIDVFERNNRLVTCIDLPGVKKEDVAVEVMDGSLLLSGERKTETEERNDNFFRSEREYGMFRRVIPLPEGVKTDEIKASFKDGVLEVSVPLPERTETRSRRIAIEDHGPGEWTGPSERSARSKTEEPARASR